MPLGQIRIVGVRESIAERIKRALLEGEFQPGENLSEPALAAEMKVSRGSVREALLVLSQDGLLVHSHNRGFATVRLTEEDAREIQEVRARLETLALERARTRIDPAAMGRLGEWRDQMVDAMQTGDRVRCLELEVRFHSGVWEASGNTWLVAALRRVMVPYFAYSVAYVLAHSPVPVDLHFQQHDLYVRYLQGACPETAEQCVQFHVNPFNSADQQGLVSEISRT